MLSARGICSGYGDVTILKDLDIALGPEVFAVLGANGAGKSTLLKTLAGLIPLKRGDILFDNVPVAHRTAYERAEMGLSYVPQENGVFADLTVAENLSIGALIGSRSRKDRLDEIFGLFPDLKARLNQKAGSLSGGEGQMVAVGRALMQEPKVLLLDEPTAGLSPMYAALLFRRVSEICAAKRVGVILAEQNAVKTMRIAHRVMVLSLGRAELVDEASEVSIERIRAGYRI